ncbi:MAG: hypothetical protein ACEPOV_09010 [Hyphomicrobiales bacterium]
MKIKYLMLIVCIFTLMGCKKEMVAPEKSNTVNLKSDPTINEAVEMITLGSISSKFINGDREDEAKALLADESLATKGNWELIWYGYKSLESVQAMIVKHKTIPNTYAVLTTGQSPTNVFAQYQGLYVFGTHDFEYVKSSSKAPQIATGLHSLIKLIVETKADCSSLGLKDATMWDVFRKITQDLKETDKLTVYVSGHSLGGTNSVMLGTYLHTKFSGLENIPDNKINMKVYDFAGPALYCQSMVDYFRNLSNDTHISFVSYLYSTENDVPPNYWPQNLLGMSEELPLSTIMRFTVKEFAKAFNKSLDLAGVQYKQIYEIGEPNRVVLKNLADPKTFKVEAGKNITFVDGLTNYYCWNHFASSYITSLGGKPVPLNDDEKAKVVTEENTHIIPDQNFIDKVIKDQGLVMPN